MALLYAVDFRTLPSQTIGAAGAYVIDGKTWWVKGQLTDGSTTLTSNLVNGSGIHFDVTSGLGTTPIGSGSALAWRHFFLPLSSINGWSSTLSYMVRGRFNKIGARSNSRPLLGVTSTTSDAVALTAVQRANEILVSPNPVDTTTTLLYYKVGTASPTTATGRQGAISNNECVVGVYHYTPRFANFGSEHLVSGMPTDPATWLAVQGVGSADFNGLRSNPGVLLAVDSGNNDWYLEQLRIETIGELLDATNPTVTLISPAQGGIARTTAIVLRVADTARIAAIHLWVAYANGVTETIYAGGAFARTFEGQSTITTITANKEYEFSVRRLGGWPSGAMEFFAEPVDGGGNLSS